MLLNLLRRGFISLCIGIALLSAGAFKLFGGINAALSEYPASTFSADDLTELQRSILLGAGDEVFRQYFIASLLLALGVLFVVSGLATILRFQVMQKRDELSPKLRMTGLALLVLVLMASTLFAFAIFAIVPFDAPMQNVAGTPYTSEDRDVIVGWLGNIAYYAMLFGTSVAITAFALPVLIFKAMPKLTRSLASEHAFSTPG